MAPDDKDLGVRPEFAAAILPVADKLDAEIKVVRKSLEPVFERATEALVFGQHAAAADAFDEIARAFRAAHFPGEAELWERRAADCRSVGRVQKRAAKKRGGRK
jgi:hypothetical protein